MSRLLVGFSKGQVCIGKLQVGFDFSIAVDGIPFGHPCHEPVKTVEHMARCGALSAQGPPAWGPARMRRLAHAAPHSV